MPANRINIAKSFALLALATVSAADARPAAASQPVRPISRSTSQTLHPITPSPTNGNDVSPEWFEDHLADAGLRELAAARFADHHRLTRDDMLAIFALAGETKELDPDQMQTLRALIQDGKQLGMPAYVADLSRKVVFGDPANAHFHGESLGDLDVGSPAAQLDALVRKWFLGEDLPVLDEKYHYAKAAGVLFDGPPKVADLHQGDLGDCYFIAPLGEVAARNPDYIKRMFIDNRDGTFTIRFYNNGRAYYVTVDRSLAVEAGGRFVYENRGDSINNPKNILWVALAEKALAQLNESGWLKTVGKSGENSFAAIGAGGKSMLALPMITGISTARDGVESIGEFVKGELQIANSKTQVPPYLIPHHSYVVVGYDAARGEVTLFNPWGLHGNKKDIKYGEFTVSWNDFYNDFMNIDHAKLAPKAAGGGSSKMLAKNPLPNMTPTRPTALAKAR